MPLLQVLNLCQTHGACPVPECQPRATAQRMSNLVEVKQLVTTHRRKVCKTMDVLAVKSSKLSLDSAQFCRYIYMFLTSRGRFMDNDG